MQFLHALKLVYLVMSIGLMAFAIYTDASLAPQTPAEALKLGLYTQLCLACILVIYEIYDIYREIRHFTK